MASLSLPAGFVGNLPIGIQIMGPCFSEEKLLEVGFAYEQATDWHQRSPDL